MGSGIQHASALSQRHVKNLTERWLREAKIPSTLLTRLSGLATFATWIGKPHVVMSPSEYFPQALVGDIISEHGYRIWVGGNLNPLALIASARQFDVRLALFLCLQYHFGMSVRESIRFRPFEALVKDGSVIVIQDEDFVPRNVPYRTPEQRDIIEWALTMAIRSRGGHLRWPMHSLEQSERRFYRIMDERYGLNPRAVGLIADGPRPRRAKVTRKQRTNAAPPRVTTPGKKRDAATNDDRSGNAFRVETATVPCSPSTVSQQPADRSLPSGSESHPPQ
jgi:hypothetical protein